MIRLIFTALICLPSLALAFPQVGVRSNSGGSCSKYKEEPVCSSLNKLKCVLKEYVCQDVLRTKCHIDPMEFEVTKKEEQCDSSGNCNIVETQVTQIMPIERCKTKKIPKSSCPATFPKFVCKRCKEIDQPRPELTDAECQADQFTFPTVDITAACLCKLVQQDPSLVSALGAQDMTGLHLAASADRPALARVLLDNGADPDTLATGSVTPLMQSASLEVTRLLIKANADVNIQNQGGLSALSIAVYNGQLDIAEALLKAGADPDIRGDVLDEPLIFEPIKNGDIAMVSLLLKHGANPDLQSAQGLTALMVAAKLAQPDIVRLLLRFNADVHLLDIEGSHALIWAAFSANPESVRILVEAGSDLDHVDSTSEELTALHYAVISGNSGGIRHLTDAGADTEVGDYLGDTPLLYAVRMGRLSALMALIEGNAYLEAVDQDNRTPLHIAATTGRFQEALALLDAGADPEAENDDSLTPLAAVAALPNAGQDNFRRITFLLVERSAFLSVLDDEELIEIMDAAAEAGKNDVALRISDQLVDQSLPVTDWQTSTDDRLVNLPFKIPGALWLVRLFDQPSKNEYETSYLNGLISEGYTRQGMVDYLAHWSENRNEMAGAVNDADIAEHLNDVLNEALNTVLTA